ncbi:response regulator transcription factor [Streptomyces fragilis]|uniref:Sensory transduction protein RegX3 n=1 Tax=Streptomyces fragilis TaxID=67301 RepID=A0ABV2YEX6_9ACTN|nr:response regulator transcription factor [Streptomyces fragilis]
MGSATGRGTSGGWRVLVVESNASDADSLVRGLRRHSHEVDHVRTGCAALDLYEQADLVLLDLELPDLDGLDVCRSIRRGSDVPVIAVTARSSELDRVLGLQAGADDYLVKPYGFRELMARIEAVMRRAGRQRTESSAIEHGPLRIDPRTRQVRVNGVSVEMTRKEFDLLHLLASHPGAVISRQQVMRQVWGGTWSRRTVDTHVSSLRNKLGERDWIVTVRGVGFQFAPE